MTDLSLQLRVAGDGCGRQTEPLWMVEKACCPLFGIIRFGAILR